MSIEVLFSPREYAALPKDDLSETTCVIFDILRATSSIVTALANGAASVQPVIGIPEALQIRQKNPEVLLAGEREGVRIVAAQTGSIDFDFANSPREFTPDRVRGKKIVMTTTNGTRALRAAAGAREVLIGAFLNLAAVGAYLSSRRPENLLLICSGTHDEAAYEDVLAAGALAAAFPELFPPPRAADSVAIAREIFLAASNDLPGALRCSRNGRRLLANAELREDVAFCLQRDCFPLCPRLGGDGQIVGVEVTRL